MQGEAISTGEWTEIEVDDPVGERTDLPSNTSFMRGSVYLSEAVAQTITIGEPWIKEAASFFEVSRSNRCSTLPNRAIRNAPGCVFRSRGKNVSLIVSFGILVIVRTQGFIVYFLGVS
jgi:hypothetical protein